jgi:putative endonuclease
MPVSVYILKSQSTGRHYCGQTDDLDHRIRQHNDSEHTLSYTTKRHPGPWVLIWSTVVATRTEALMLERRIKKRGIARFLQDQGGC